MLFQQQPARFGTRHPLHHTITPYLSHLSTSHRLACVALVKAGGGCLSVTSLWLCLQDRRVALAEGRAVPQDLLGVLLTAADEAGQTLTDEELWEDIHDVMGAGVCQ